MLHTSLHRRSLMSRRYSFRVKRWLPIRRHTARQCGSSRTSPICSRRGQTLWRRTFSNLWAERTWQCPNSCRCSRKTANLQLSQWRPQPMTRPSRRVSTHGRSSFTSALPASRKHCPLSQLYSRIKSGLIVRNSHTSSV
jgi:hypothetical protein